MLDEEHDNLLAALRFAADEGDAETAVRIAASLGWYWMILDSHAEAATWMGVALDVPGAKDQVAHPLVAGLHAVNAAASGQIDLSDPAGMQHLLDSVPPIDTYDGHPLLALVSPAKALLSEDFPGFESGV